MTKEEKIIYNCSKTRLNIVDIGRSHPVYTRLDLSQQNEVLSDYDITDALQCQAYIDAVLYSKKADIAYGGYLERRNLYQNSTHFNHAGQQDRNIHLGIDLWVKAGTPLLAPLSGKIHSFANNGGYGNYGPTIILVHSTPALKFYTLYGHLSRTSLENIAEGKIVSQGSVLGAVGNTPENGGYAPHLHFQIILELQGYKGDYPGVSTHQDRNFYQKNCPDPNLLLKI